MMIDCLRNNESIDKGGKGVNIPYICTRMWMWFSEGWGTLWDGLVSGG